MTDHLSPLAFSVADAVQTLATLDLACTGLASTADASDRKGDLALWEIATEAGARIRSALTHLQSAAEHLLDHVADDAIAFAAGSTPVLPAEAIVDCGVPVQFISDETVARMDNAIASAAPANWGEVDA
ncbi:hypothetical protein [Prescottella equi]